MSEGAFFGGVTAAAVAGVGIFGALLSSAYVIDEGRVGVVTYMGKAERQETPAGLQFKAPFVAGVREFDVRERALPINISAATSNQLNTTADVSFNWRPDPARVMEIFVKYGSPDDFATNVLMPRLAQSAKATIGTFSSVELTQERNAVAEAILTDAQRILDSYPAILSSAQVENFSLPERYWEAVLQREEQREVTEREKLLLEQQKLQAQRDVQTAEAQRDAAKAQADGVAYATRTQAEAQSEATLLAGDAEAAAMLALYQARADGLASISEALGDGDLAVKFSNSIAWDGKLPTTILGDAPELLIDMTGVK